MAYKFATANAVGSYPVGSVIYEVSWQLQPDEQWFGANIPQRISNVERIEFVKNNKPLYSKFDNKGYKLLMSQNMQERIIDIIGKRMAISPQ